ncbi:hypothetical protein ACNTMW_14865 [Planosporangium sp. 12N6]|uniref:hypothetical protein n=1 Tax=Planosporangium spinosum TaxID=3402278 RepID=UPI003CF5C608
MIDSEETGKPYAARLSPRATLRWGKVLLGLGLAGGLVWSAVVQSSMPSWFDPGGACANRSGGDGGDVTVRTSVFPPRATCTFSDGSGTVDYISPGKSLVFSVILGVLLVSTVAGLVLLGRQLLRRHPAASAVGERTNAASQEGGTGLRAVVHLLAAAALGIAATYVGPYAAIVVAFLAGVPAIVVTAAVIVLAVIVLSTALDTAVGPGYGDRVDSRRRGVAVGGIGSAVVLVLLTAGVGRDAFTAVLEPPPWLTVAAGVLFAGIVAVQWLNVGNSEREPVP